MITFKKHMRRIALGAVAFLSVSNTLAYNVGDYVAGGGYVREGSYLDTASAAVQNSTLVTERRVATAAAEAQTNMVLTQITERFDPTSTPTGNSVALLPTKGGNAGPGDQRSSLWARAGIDNLRENNINSFGGWNANLWSLALGYDHKVNEKVLLGAALTYSNLNGDTKFNRGSIRDNAFGIVPYIAFRVNPCLNFDVVLGYNRVNKSRSRTTPGLAGTVLSGPKATSSPKSDRYFASLYANYKHFVNRWTFLTRFGYLYVTDKQKRFNEQNGMVAFNPAGNPTGTATRVYNSQNTNVSRLSLRLQAGYKASTTVEPYAFVLYARDFGATKIRVQDTVTPNAAGIALINPNKQRSDNTFGGGLGLNGHLGNNWKTGIEAVYAQSKKFRDIGGSLRISKTF
ncbi:MAG: autotransporter outer membrane beta-barrel domain-containing protein [Alphaproteobacteria bacterium]|nr:autotransporter outer membrane beta-barrel domain-containing protein [Alphaproteobacteria bacterium]